MRGGLVCFLGDGCVATVVLVGEMWLCAERLRRLVVFGYAPLGNMDG